jgi:error-prone DNA polymerase
MLDACAGAGKARLAVARIGTMQEGRACPGLKAIGILSVSEAMSKYTELQVTTPFSFLRGASHAEELVAQAKHLGLSGLAVTDRNSLAGAVRMHAAAKDAGLQCIIGARLDLAAATHGETPQGLHVVSDRQPLPARCLPGLTDRAAYGRLTRLISLGQRRAGKGECLITLDDVAEFQQGLILCAVPPPGWPDDAFEATLAGHDRPP